MEWEDKPVYMEGDKTKIWDFLVSLYVVAYKRENGKMATIPMRADEELLYLQIVKNFVLPRDEDLAAQPSTGAGELTNLGIGPEKKKQRTFAAVNIAPKKTDASKAQSSKAKKGEKKGTRHSSDSLCDYVVVSNSLEGLAPVVAKKPKAEPRDPADIHANPEDPIDLESSPEPLMKTKAGKRKQVKAEAEVQPAKKVQRRKIGKRGNLDAFIAKPPPVVARDPEKGKSVPEDPVITVPTSATTSTMVHVVRSPSGDQVFTAHNEEDSPIRPEETPRDYDYRSYSEKKASEIHTPVWKLKKGDTFSDWQVCRDWLQGTFHPVEVKFQENRSHDQSYHAYLEEAASFTSTTHRIVREWRSMHKEWSNVEASKKKAAEEEAWVALLRAKLEADQASLRVIRRLKSGLPLVGKEKQKPKPLFFWKSASVGEKSVKRIVMKKWVSAMPSKSQGRD
ncbi:hypothetical protein Hdeb2414_s0001g00020401 [Helianthus debilis subsp. tardiflorus]